MEPTVPADGVSFLRSNYTKLARNSGKIGINCDHCGLLYETYACWAKRYANHFCSRACKDAHAEIKIDSACEICGEKFITTPTVFSRKTTCSKKCSSEKKRRRLKKHFEVMPDDPT